MSALDGVFLLWLIVLSGYVVWKGKTGPLGFTGPEGRQGPPGPAGVVGPMPSDADIERVVRRVAFESAKESGKTDEERYDCERL